MLPALSLVPEFRGQNGQDGEDFQAAEEHGDTGHGFGEGGEDGVGAGGSGDAKARPDAAHGGDADAYGVDHANAVKDEEEGEEDIHHDVDEEVTGDVEEDLIRQVDAVHGDVGHQFRMEFLPDEGLDEAQHDHEAQNFEAAGGGAGAAPYEHEKEEDGLREGRPGVEVVGNKAGGGAQGGGLKYSVAKGRAEAEAHFRHEV